MLFGYLVLSSLFSTSAANSERIHRSLPERENGTYDYVIVGGGVTGLIVANRLTEDRNRTVLVVEAGDAYDNPNIRLPAASANPLNTTLLWNYVCEPEPYLANKTWNTRVAKVLGGGSIVNGMMYDRGAAADYDAWEALGNKGWGWQGLYPFFKKSTEFTPPAKETVDKFGITWDPEAYGKGPLKLGTTNFQYPDVLSIFQAFKGAGANLPRDGNNGEAYGASWFPNTMNPRTGERSHARNSYYEPVSDRPNLKVLLQTEATELVFDGSKKLVAHGIKITDLRTGISSTVFAKKEVVLAAGAVNTPKLLQLSGVGPRAVLEAAGINVKLEHDGVGANFQDHPYTTIAFNISNASYPNPNTIATDSAFNASAWEQYRANKTGPLTFARGNSLAFIPLPEVDPQNYRELARSIRDQKDDEYLPTIYKGSNKLSKGVQAQRKVLAGLFENTKAGILEFAVAAGAGSPIALQKPLSRGSITINSSNPQGAPRVFYNTISNPIDRAVIAAGMRYIRTIWARPEMRKFSPIETSPGPQYNTDDEIIDRVVGSGSLWPTFSHPAGSCAMMPEEHGGCVSDELLFYGIDRLSIIDASIIPLLPSQHLQSTMYAVGEKAAQIIKDRA